MSEPIINNEKIVDFLALFLLGTIAFFFYLLSPQIGVELGRFGVPVVMAGIFSYEFVVLNLMNYYFTRNKHSFINHVKSHKAAYFGAIFVVLALSYAVIEYLQNGMLAAVKSVLYAALFVIAIPLVNHLLEKITGTKPRRGADTNA